MMTNCAVNADYARIAGVLPGLTGGQPVGGPGEIGVLAFHSSVPVVDFFGDRAATRPYLDERERRAGSAMAALLRWNWTYRPDPDPQRCGTGCPTHR